MGGQIQSMIFRTVDESWTSLGECIQAQEGEGRGQDGRRELSRQVCARFILVESTATIQNGGQTIAKAVTLWRTNDQ